MRRFGLPWVWLPGAVVLAAAACTRSDPLSPAFAGARVYSGPVPSFANACRADSTPAGRCTRTLVACANGRALYSMGDTTYLGAYHRQGNRLLLTLATSDLPGGGAGGGGTFRISTDARTLTAERDGGRLTVQDGFQSEMVVAQTCSS